MYAKPGLDRARGSSLADRWIPALRWARQYDGRTLSADLLAALIVTVMLIPQSLAYAMLAGLPPETGLYASIMPLVAYAVFGTSRTLSVGPVAVISLLTASALSQAGLSGEELVEGALVLALLSGLMLLGLGLLRLGWLANLLSHPVISGFITASAIIIAAGQVRHLIGVKGGGETLPEVLVRLWEALPGVNLPTVLLGFAALAALWWMRSGLAPLLRRAGLPDRTARMAARAGPMMVIGASILAVWLLRLDASGVAIVGDIPGGLPPLTVPGIDPALWTSLAIPAALISIIGFAESVSVGQTLAAKRRQSIDPDQELVGLGTANISAAFTGGLPVTGGFSRSVVNFDAGAETPAAGAFAAVGIAVATLLLTPLIRYLPIAALAATIIVAVLSLVDIGALRRSWTYSRSDFSAMAATILGTLLIGVEAGLIIGVALSIGLHLWRTMRPHAAIIGQVPGTEHFRNVQRHEVVTSPRVLAIRVDESLFFANARAIESLIQREVAESHDIRHVVLQCSAVNFIDGSALESLELLITRLCDAGIAFHLSEVKGPVMDRLRRTEFLDHLTGGVFLTQRDAMLALDPETTRHADNGRRTSPPDFTGGAPRPWPRTDVTGANDTAGHAG